MDISCDACYQQDGENLYCSVGQDINSGFCCNQEANKATKCKSFLNQTSSFCARGDDGRFGGALKYIYCPYNQQKCGSEQKKLVA